MRFRLLVFLPLLIFSLSIRSQTYYISGSVTDSLNGESVPGVLISVKSQNIQAQTNPYGYYSIGLPKGRYTIVYNMVGYLGVEIEVDLNRSLNKSIKLSPDKNELGQVKIRGQKNIDRNIRSTEMGRVELPGEKIKQIPALFGEPDVLRILTLLPGIKSGGEGSTGFYVRGGGPDQNLVLIDEGVVYNASHLLGFFSVFNADAVKNVEVIKGGMPAQYGGRLSSIVNVSMKEGNNQRTEVKAGIGLISSRLSVEGPISKGKSSFIISARRTYIDRLVQPFLNEQRRGSGYYFYDLNAKGNIKLGNRDNLYLSLYNGKDVFSYKSPRNSSFKVGIDWGNTVASLRWSHAFRRNGFVNTSLIYNTYGFNTEASFGRNQFQLYSGLKDITLKTDITQRWGSRQKIMYGGQYILHTFTPGIASFTGTGTGINAEIQPQLAREGALYITDEVQWNSRLSTQTGLRFSHFRQTGPYDQAIYFPDGTRSDSMVRYSRGETIAAYQGLEPRLAFRWITGKSSSFKGSVSRTLQYLHLATSAGATLPTDLWIPSSAKVKPQISWQYALGYFQNFDQNMWESSVEVYYKPMFQQIEFKPGAQLFFNQNLENEIITGQGLSYGAEFFIKKNQGDITGWIGYTWSIAERTFRELNNGRPYFYRYDRRHDVSLVLSWNFKPKWNANFVWVFGSGNWLTLPVGGVLYNVGINSNTGYPGFFVLNQYQNISNYRMPAYHRADIGVTWKKTFLKKYEQSWNFSLYNIYNRKNPYFIYNEPDAQSGSIKWFMVYLFPILPSVNWNVSF